MNPAPRHVVLIGNGMVGSRFADEVARRDPAGERVRLTVAGAETDPAYNRVLLPGLVAGTHAPDDIRLPFPDGPAVTLRTGTAATHLDTAARRVTLDDGTALHYDELVLATGARAALPPLDGVTAPDGAPAEGVSALRDMADTRRVLALTRPGAPVVVLGGGVLGLEAARALVERGARVSLVESSPWIMRRQIDRPAAEILARRYAAIGVEVHSWRVAARWIPGTGLELDDGRVLAGDALVVTAGVRAETGLAEGAGIPVDRGVLVDDRLTSGDPRVHAIGDCAQHTGGGAGLVQPGWEQAAILADLLTGTNVGARYHGARPVTRLKAEGIDLTALGEADAEESAETVTIADPHGGRYAKLSVREGRIAGAVLLGFPDSASAIAQIYDGDAPVPDDRLALLMGQPQADAETTPEAADPLICRCNAVARSTIESAWLDGNRTREAIAGTTRATTGCGGCTRDVDALLSQWASTTPAKVP
ncbi:FAD-dependent oxidoreductase [Nocardiopsis sediminis]|uniref:FAD-dependent oxidoreductase n=1 Tax=Nocardiopsis sediminis TaxID=1778267 RepID=A0ABV8FMY4_9ACTN